MISLAYNFSGTVSEICTIILYLTFIISTLYTLIYIFLKSNKNDHKGLSIGACFFLVFGLIENSPILINNNFDDKKIRQLFFIVFEIGFLSYFFSTLFYNIKKYLWLITAIVFSSLALLILENNKLFEDKDGIKLNMYYIVFSFLVTTLIFIFLIFTKHQLVDLSNTKKSIFLILMGILIFYILKMSSHTSIAYLKYNDMYYLINPFLFNAKPFSIVLFTDLIGYIILSISIEKAVVSLEK